MSNFGTRLLARLKLPQKLLLIAALFMIPIALLVINEVSDGLRQIQAAERALKGEQMMDPLSRMIRNVQLHRGLSQQAIAGSETARARLPELRRAIEAAISEADAIEAKLGAEMGIRNEWAGSKSAWRQLEQRADGLGADASLAEHTELAAAVRDLILVLANRSGMSVDPDLATNYLARLFSVYLVPMTENMGIMRAASLSVVERGQVGAEMRTRIATLASRVADDRATITKIVDSIRAADPDLVAGLGVPLRSFDAATTEYLEMVTGRVIQGFSPAASSQEVLQISTAAIDASFELYALATSEYRERVEARKSAVLRSLVLTLVVLAGTLLLVLYFFLAFRASLLSAIGALRSGVQRMAAGNFAETVALDSRDELADIAAELNATQAQLRDSFERERAAANAALRIKNALDVSSNCVMVADADCEIIYCNRAIFEMFSKVESQMRQQMPGFSVAGLLGSNIDMYHRQPAHQRGMLANLKGEHRAEIEVGGRLFSLIANPIVNEQGERLGTVVEWRDRTQEAAVEQEVAQIIAMAGRGDFAQRLDTSRMEGFFLELSKGINGLLEAVELAVSDVARLFGRLAEGDLTQRIEADYEGLLGELKNDANQTIDTLESTLGRIMEASRSVSTAAQEIAHGNQDLSSRTEEQAASLEQTAASMEELTSTVKANAESAREARQMASLAADTAGKGSRSVQQMVGTMSEIEQAARKIVDIIAVIDGIAFQTNILALNAAVEAARAGEQGRGFAVVAGEVRSLAQRSAAAAKEIKALISDSVSKVEQGTTLAGQTGTVIAEVVDSVGRVAEVVADISAASAEQSSGIEQVNTAITHMDDVTQQNAALVEQASAAAESLEEQANVMVEAVSVFRMQSGGGMLGVGSQVSVPPARPAPARGVGSGAPVPAAAAKGRRKVAAPLPPVGADDDDWQDF